jgi:hypothetical protein
VALSLLQAVDDRELLGAAFSPWPQQRERLAALDAGPRIHLWALGRRSAKTTTAAVGALHNLLFRPDLDARMRRGEMRFAVGVATNQQQGRLLIAAARTIVEASPILAALLVGSNEDRLTFELPSGQPVALAAFPCSARAGRGWPISFLVCDEAAHFLDADGYQSFDRVFGALVPATAQFGDRARILVCSTPYGDEGGFADLFAKARSGELADAVAVQAPTWECNPTVDAAFLEAERVRDPEGFDAEYGAQFLGSGGAYLDMGRFEIAARGALEPDALAAGSAIAGLDPAFAQDDFGIAVVGRCAADPHRFRLALVDAWSPPRADDFESRRAAEDHILDAVADVCHRYGASAVTDQYLAKSVVSRLTKLGIPVEVHSMSAASKSLAYGELRSQLYTGALEVYADAQLVAELRRLRTKHTAGSSHVVSPRVGGSHGDRAQALALAAWAQAQRGGYGGRLPGGGLAVSALSRAARGLL